MDPMLRWGIRLAQWFRRPPSRRRVILMITVVVFCLGLVAIERFIGWPDALTLGHHGPRIIRH